MASSLVPDTTTMQDPYEVLGVQRTATLDEIKMAYKRLALQYHPDKNQEQPETAAERFKAIATAYSILSDPDKRRRFDAGGLDSLQQSDFEIDFSELGRIDAMMVAMFARMGVPFRTAVAKSVLLAAESGEFTTRQLQFGETVSGKVDRQAAEYFELDITQEAIASGFCIFCHSQQQSRFKLLLFDKSSGAHWSLVTQEDSTKMGKVTLAGFYFLGFATYQLPPPSLPEIQARAAAVQQEPELEFFAQLETLRERPLVQLQPGKYLVAVYGDNWFKKAFYSLQPVLCSEAPPQALRVAEESLSSKQQGLRTLEKEYFAAKKAYTEACAKVETYQTELQAIMKQREEAYLDLHGLAAGRAVATASGAEAGRPLSGLRSMFGFGRRRSDEIGGGAAAAAGSSAAATPTPAGQPGRGMFSFTWRKQGPAYAAAGTEADGENGGEAAAEVPGGAQQQPAAGAAPAAAAATSATPLQRLFGSSRQ